VPDGKPGQFTCCSLSDGRVYHRSATSAKWDIGLSRRRFVAIVEACYNVCRPIVSTGEMLSRQTGGSGLGLPVAGTGDRVSISHGGANMGYRAFMVLYPVTGDGVAVMTNGEGGRELRMEVVRAVSRVYDWPDYHPEKDYTKFRIALWLCVAVFGSAVLIWPLLFFLRRLMKIQTSNRPRIRTKLSAAAKFLVCLSGLFCIIFLLGVLLIPEALEFIAVNGLPPSLPLYWIIISYTPWLCIVAVAPILVLNITAWIRKYWTIAERLHFGLVSITIIVFIWLSFTLNMVPDLP